MESNEPNMTKGDIIAGRRFYCKDEYISRYYSFSKLFGKRLAVKNGSQRHIGEVTEIFEDSFMLSTCFFNQEVSIIIPYSELIIIEPKSK